jgi:tRNA-dihydrouridine synthase
MKNFWIELYKKKKVLNEPIIVIAPMADVTDYVFRNLIARKSNETTSDFSFRKIWSSLFKEDISEKTETNSHLDVLWTEFVSVNGLSNPKGREALIKDLRFNKENERPIVAQIFGEDPEKFTEIAKLCEDLGFDGVDINMGCPDKNVLGQKAGSYLIQTPEIAKQIVENTKIGAKNIPVSVKTRIGYNEISWKIWFAEILKTKPVTFSIHLRTRKEMSLVEAHWEIAPEIVAWIRENFGYPENGGPIILLNGDVKSIEDAYKKWQDTRCDGIMIGRGIFGNPWFFSRKVKKENLSTGEILRTLVEHTYAFEKELSFKSFSIMKKHFKAYVNGFDHAKDLRIKLMDCKNGKEVEKEINKFLFWQKFSFIKRFFKIK